MFRSANAGAVQRGSVFYIAIAAVLLLLISGIDYFTGPAVVVVFLYFIPLYIVAWYAGFKVAIFTAVFASLADFFADFQQTDATGILLWNSAVRFVVFIGFCYLLTDRRAVERELRKTENSLFQLLEALPVGVLVIASNGEPYYSNPASLRILGQEPAPNLLPEDRAKVFSVYKSGTDRLYSAQDLPIARALRGERVFVDDMEIHREGRIIPLHVHAAPIFGDGGAIEFAIAAFTDVSEIKSIQQQLMAQQKILEQSVLGLSNRNKEIGFINEMVDLLQSAAKEDEAYTISRKYLERLLPDTSGAVYVMRESRNLLEPKISWGRIQKDTVFAPDDCWAVRRAQIYFAGSGETLKCKHSWGVEKSSYVCIPMIALGQIVGVVYIVSDQTVDQLRLKETGLKAIVEQVGMALSNLKLRETLRSQAIRDPLTGLFNRRYLEETLERELNRARRKNRALSLIMLDVDHFKRFNDQYGHPAGDELLNSLGKILTSRARRDDIVCRYGGEEFLLILPECGLEDAGHIAESIRKDAMALWIQSTGAEPVVSISAGVASYPENGESTRALIAATDRALYQAKAGGRNRVCLDLAAEASKT